ESYKFNGWELDINSRSLIGPDGEQYKLPRSEFRAMLHFCENPVAIFILGQLLKRTLGGQTGDTLGAAIELGELIFLLALL
ncbi:adenosylcobinamide-GDP ribazoletransferase, partial [Salmonella enterica subsp. enterica serovar Anatum]|nr:adenosylcobinamide-GDP ribazoletransferase [Salmonella enterica subsp. enterica serovar Anatum]